MVPSAARSTSSPLLSRIAARIREDGPIRFDVFQEIALYDPEHGYYERPGRIDREGDFVTGASWHPAFARAIARVARRVRDEIGPITIVDAGAGEGRLLRWLAESLRDERGVGLAGIERSERRRAIAEREAPAEMHASPETLRTVRGLVLAYELVDALPVRALRVAEDGSIRERHVSLAPAGGLELVDLECADGEEIRASLAARGARLERGQLFEVRPGAPHLARALAGTLESGLVLVFDYGAPARALYGPARSAGTLEAFSKHQVTRDVLAEPGERDITAWVDFTELGETLSEEGLTVRGLVSQSRLLLAAGIAGELAVHDPERPAGAALAAERNAIAKLFAPGGMGEAIRVLVAERGTSVGASLMAFPEGK